MNIVIILALLLAIPIAGALVMNAIENFDDWMEDEE